VVGLWAAFSPTPSTADPIRLRADALAEARAPAGLVVLQGADREHPWFGAEALVWAGARTDASADVLVLTFRLREPHGLGDLRGGRFVFASGAIRPIHLDGGSVLARAPWGSMIEAFGGAPVVPRFGERAYDWVAGGRASQSVASRVTVGSSYVQRRIHGDLANEEVGADFAAVPSAWLDLAAKSAYDLGSSGVADALVSAAIRVEPVRVELFATHRSPSRLLPATSLFSVLGDFPSQVAGTSIRWFAAPRLDLWGTAAAQRVGDELGGNGSLRALLRTDDQGRGTLGLEVRRQHVSSARWTGVRTTMSEPLGFGLRWSSELELAVPDDSGGRGTLWPWGLAALGWRSASGWETACAVEAGSDPLHTFTTNAVLRVSRVMEVP
jgi:hypothetical protein